MGFATPAVGNAALADYAKAKGWDRFITNYLVPGMTACMCCCCSGKCKKISGKVGTGAMKYFTVRALQS